MIHTIKSSFQRMYKYPIYKVLLYIFGIFSFPIVLINYLKNKTDNRYLKLKEEIRKDLIQQGIKDELYKTSKEQLENKLNFFKKKIQGNQLDKQTEEIVEKKFNYLIECELERQASEKNIKNITIKNTFINLFENKAFLIFSFIVSFPMYILMLIFNNPFAKYILERLVMMMFVIVGVTCLVFTILYLSPMDPAVNILGQGATPEQIVEFNNVYGLNNSYVSQLFKTVKSLFTFDLGKSYVGNEDVLSAIMRKFPVTLQITFTSLVIAVIIAIPAGIISAIKQYSSFDYVFMLLALIGLSIPSFWMGLVMILNFSIKMQLLPATFVVGDIKTLIMPSIVLGTSLAATVARMTRSSMLEVKNMDYIVTARAKGLSEKRVVIKHILGNAMIPIVTVIGLQFGGMMGGSAVVEKVFNINGIGSFIVDKQFIPDVPIVLAGVVYVAVIISLVNLVVDIMYAFLDPRIKSKMKSY